MATTNKTVSRDRVMATYCIMQRIPLDVERIITAQIRSVFSKPRGQLFFPWLIIGLCVNAAIGSGNFLVDVEQIVLVNEVINKKNTSSASEGIPTPIEHCKGIQRSPEALS